MTHQDQKFLDRALELAQKAGKYVRPNPQVGAVLVYNNQVIGEGWHKKLGQAHAEVNCIESVRPEDQSLIAQSTLYVTLEPCSHHGKTPPCTDLIIRHRIPKVVVGTTDPFPQVNGSGISRLRNEGIEVLIYDKDNRYEQFIKPFTTFHLKKRPYVILKWAESADFFLGKKGEQTNITQPATQLLVHQWREDVEAIMVGTETVLIDNPKLTNRYSDRGNPLRCIPDQSEKISESAHIKNDAVPTLIWTKGQSRQEGHISYSAISEFTPARFLADLYNRNISTVLVEGGRKMLQSFIESGYWDEARILQSPKPIHEGIPSPFLTGRLISKQKLGLDRLQVIGNAK